MPTNQLYHTWIQRIRELRPGQRITQVRNFALLMYGIYQSRSVYLSRIAGKVPGKAKLPSTVKRFERFLSNSAIRVRDWYQPIAQQWLAEQLANLGELHLIVDGTKVGFGHQLLMFSLAYRKRAIPIAWTWVRHVCAATAQGTSNLPYWLMSEHSFLARQRFSWLATPNLDLSKC